MNPPSPAVPAAESGAAPPLTGSTPVVVAAASCCAPAVNSEDHCAHTTSARPDWLLRGSTSLVATSALAWWLAGDALHELPWLHEFCAGVVHLLHLMWWGLVFGVVMTGFLARVPREFVVTALGRPGFSGVLRASVAGVMLDLCSHGILLVAAKLYERGASTGQVMAFLIASPWNSLSLTLILVALIGLPWTVGFIALSMLVAVLTGTAFDRLIARGDLPANPHAVDLPADFAFWPAARHALAATRWTPALFGRVLRDGVRDSRMVMRWLLFGILLAALLRVLLEPATFATWFGPTLAGLGLTLLGATLLEVCSEGSLPIASDLIVRAQAPGNGFAFLMAGVATDYTEILVLREMARSWKLALALPLISVPQIILIGWLINTYAV